ncbi:MAG: ATP-binding protein [Sphingomicrobium sp.]
MSQRPRIRGTSDGHGQSLGAVPGASVPIAAAGFVAAVAGLVLIGWIEDLPALTQLIPGLTAMNPMSATSFLLIALTLALMPRLPFAGIALLGGLISGIGIAKLTQLAQGGPLGIDQLLFAAKLGHGVGVPPNRMAPNTAVALILAGVALIAGKSRSKVGIFVSQGLSLLLIAIALFAVIGYVLGIVALYEVRAYNAMALHSAIAFLITAIGIFGLHPRACFLRVLSDRGPAGQLARFVLPLTVFVPVAVGLMRVGGERYGVYDHGQGVAIQVFANVLVTFVLMMSSILLLYRSDLARRSVEQAVARSEDEFRLAERMGRVGHWRIDLRDRRLSCSDEFMKICGFPAGMTPSRSAIMALFDAQDAASQRGATRLALKEGIGWDANCRISRPGGELRHIRSHGVSETDAAGRVVSLFGVFVDITELEGARRQAQEALESKAAFLANMSHEVRTPLNAIIGFTDLILEGPTLAAPVRRQLELVKTAGDALLTVVNDILDFSKMEAGKVDLVSNAFDLDFLVESSASIVRQSAETKGLALALNIDRSLRRSFVGDDGRLRQILLNLLSNAIKFTRHGSVTLDVTHGSVGPDASRAILFTVTDSGQGIKASEDGQLFERFAQANSAIGGEHGGTGLGLAICRNLVTLMGGSIGHRPNPAGGSIFWFEVNLREVGYTSEPRLPPLSASRPGAALTILVVEDVPVNQELAAALLTRKGHSVVIANNGKEAIVAIQQGEFNLILMDIQMPVMDGITATRLIRLLPGRTGTTPIVALSANVMADQIDTFREAGMNDHIAKPIRLRDLDEAIARNARGNQIVPNLYEPSLGGRRAMLGSR